MKRRTFWPVLVDHQCDCPASSVPCWKEEKKQTSGREMEMLGTLLNQTLRDHQTAVLLTGFLLIQGSD